MILNEKDTEAIRNWSGRLDRSVSIELLQTEDARSERFEIFCGELAAATAQIQVVTRRSEKAEPPAILVGAAHWRYHAIPSGAELEPFLDILRLSAHGDAGLAEPLRNRLRRIVQPLHWKVFIAEQCPFCPRMVRQLAPVPLVHTLSRVTVIDGFLFPEMAEPFRIKAVPTVILNDSLRWTGQVPLSEILDIAEKEDPEQFETEAFKRMLKEGQASRIAGMMVERNRIFPAFVPLLVDPEWSVRLGALVVAEEIAGASPDLARKFLEPLWEVFHDQDPTVKGDIVYLIGETGHREEWIPRLEALLQTEKNEELLSAIQEVISNYN